MMMPSIFGENLFNDWMDFSFPDIDKKLYGKRADRMMKTDVKETEHGYEVAIKMSRIRMVPTLEESVMQET